MLAWSRDKTGFAAFRCNQLLHKIKCWVICRLVWKWTSDRNGLFSWLIKSCLWPTDDYVRTSKKNISNNISEVFCNKNPPLFNWANANFEHRNYVHVQRYRYLSSFSFVISLVTYSRFFISLCYPIRVSSTFFFRFESFLLFGQLSLRQDWLMSYSSVNSVLLRLTR